MAALERKAARAHEVKSSGTQHAAALRGLEAAKEGPQHSRVGVRTSKFEGGRASIERFEAAVPADPEPSSSAVSTSPGGFFKAKQALKQKEEADQHGAHKGSQMEEAMRKLHSQGVVSTKQAYAARGYARACCLTPRLRLPTPH